ncbi:MAG: beta-propeller fold lactonase family protein [Gammaproteobacteria bacterium]|nr:beta-propeller fold lactonase family protein [Gammaproteobacteria bacterium]
MKKVLATTNEQVKSITTLASRATLVRLITLVMASLVLAACGGGSSSSGSSGPSGISGLDWSVVSGGISLDWNNFPGASNYIISRNGINPLNSITITDSSYTDNGVALGNTYAYLISACDSSVCYANVSLTVDYFNPTAINNFKAVVNVGSIDLTWDASSYADNHNINRSGEVLAVNPTNNAYMDRDVTTSETYNYKITACNRVRCVSTAPVTITYAVPVFPSDLSRRALNGVISLDWDDVNNAASYTISRNGTIPLDALTITDSNYTDAGIDSGVMINNSYAYQVDACNLLGCSGPQTFTVHYYPLNLANVDNVADGGDLQLQGATSVTVAEVNGSSYLFVAGVTDDGVSVFSVGDNGSLANVDNVADEGDLELDGATSVAVAEVGNSSYLFVTSQMDGGVSVFSVAANGSLANVDNVADNSAPDLDGDRSVTVAEAGGNSYLFVASSLTDNVISVFRVNDDGSLSKEFERGGFQNFRGDRSVTVADVDGRSYLFVVGFDDDGVIVFSVAADGDLVEVANVVDEGDLQLLGARSITVVEVSGSSYLFVAGGRDDGASVFSVATNGSLANVANVDDGGFSNLHIIQSITVAEVGGSSYLFAANTNSDEGGSASGSVSVFSVGDDGTLTNVANVFDDNTIKLSGTSSVTVAEVGGSSYLFVAGFTDNGVSVFQLTRP